MFGSKKLHLFFESDRENPKKHFLHLLISIKSQYKQYGI